MQFWIKAIPMFFLLTACGGPKTSVQKTQNTFETTYENNPVVLKKQTAVCEKQNSSSGFFDLQIFLSGLLSRVSHDFTPILNGALIQDDKVILQTLYGERSEYVQIGDRFEFVGIERGKALEICSDNFVFRRETVESAALNTSYFIHKTHKIFKSVNPGIKIDPITLNISPSLQRSVVVKVENGKATKRSSYMTDNAFYMPTEKSITFLPHSEQMKSSGLDINYWEVPMVASHEYGHHIFQSIYIADTLRPPEGCFGPSHKTPQKNNFKSWGIRKVTIDDVINAYNEGFADLISWYTLDEFERDVRGVKCLEISRDIGSSRFYDGKPKKFSVEAVRTFFSPTEENFLRSCELVSYQDVHTFGAVFAHTTEELLSYLGIRDEEKLAVVVEWVKFLKSERRKHLLMPPETYLKSTYSKLVRLGVDKSSRIFNRRTCKKVEELFSELNLSECSLQRDL